MNKNNLSEPSLCKNNCGFYGNPQFKNYCSKCFNDITSSTKSNNNNNKNETCNKVNIKIEENKNDDHQNNIEKLNVNNNIEIKNKEDHVENKPVVKKKRNVCAMNGCRKKLLLTSVECKCGYTFCSQHRYAEQHNCQYDYKGSKQDLLTKMNPQVVPSKITEI